MRRTLFTAALLLAACQTTPTGPERADVQGAWAWVSTSGGIAGSVMTPASEGYQASLELSADGTARGYRDGALVGTSQYRVQERLSLVAPGSGPEYEITFDPQLQLFPFGTLETYIVRWSDNGTTLTLEAPCCDQYNHTFQEATLH